MKNFMLTMLLLIISFNSFSQLKQGKENINKLCGCFDLDFKYAETFSPDSGYTFKNRERFTGKELVIPISTSKDKMVLQHLLIINDNFIIKHWREDWKYQAADLLVYQGNKKWIKQTIPTSKSKGKWTQTVWEVDDAPRYQGTGTWISNQEKTYWENTSNAPLPRREYTTRNDYHILKRGNRIVVSNNGWVHDQDNDKIALVNGVETLIAQEKGVNIYHKIKDENCLSAKKWWGENGAFWNTIRYAWEEVIKNQPTIVLNSKIDNKRLDEHFTKLFKQWNNKSISLADAGNKATIMIKKFVTNDNDTALK